MGGAGRISRKHRNRAADWLAREKSGMSGAEREEYLRWLANDPLNRAAMDEMRATWAFLEKPRFCGDATPVMSAIADRSQIAGRRRAALRISIAGLGLVAAVFLVLPKPARHLPASSVVHQGSVVTNPEIRNLPDGSVVELDAGTRIEVTYGPAVRSVRMMGGEAHFKVAKNPQRPFVVSAGSVSVRAVGTAFAVRFDPEKVDVLVTEGRVAVESDRAAAGAPNPDRSRPSRTVYLDADHRLTVPSSRKGEAELRAQAVTPDEIATALAWRKARVEFTDTPLSEALPLFNRRNQVQLSLSCTEVGAIRISGIFWTDDPRGFARLLQVSAGLGIVGDSENRIVLGKR
jgi:transmembrane sensor